MANLKDRMKIALDESRTLVLGVQVLLGFEYRAVLETGFDKLPRLTQYLKLGSHTLLLVAVAFLMLPVTYHQIVEDEGNRRTFLSLVTRVTGIALFPFAAALAVDLYVAMERITGTLPAVILGFLAGIMALVLWYGLAIVHRSGGHARESRSEESAEESHEMEGEEQDQQEGSTPIKDKVNYVLTETRVVLPGAQALLGFQLAAVLVEGFEKLPEASKYMHLGSTLAVALSTMLLMAPAAYHRIAENGENTRHFVHFANRMLIAAMVLLAPGLAGDFYVVLQKVTGSAGTSAAVSLAVLIFFYGLWFGFTLYRRQESRKEQGRQAQAEAQQGQNQQA